MSVELHQNAAGKITDIINFFNITNKNYPDREATRKGINTAKAGDYKKAYLLEKEKEVGVVNPSLTRPDFSDFIERKE